MLWPQIITHLAIKADQHPVFHRWDGNMIKAYSIAALLLVLVPSSVLAQRAGDAALGAVAGAVVLGPVGAVAGAFVGYTAGPSISRSWGLEGSRSSRHRRQASRDSVRGARAEAVGAAPSSPVRPNGADAPPAILRRTRRAPPASYRPSRLSTERIRPPDRGASHLPAPARPPTVAAAPPLRCMRPRPRPWPRRCRETYAASNSAARRSRCDRHD